MRHTQISMLAAASLLASCGQAQLERLEGEPAAAHPWTTETSRRNHPAVDGCQRFVAAARAGDGAAMWAQLSAATRKALDTRARAAGLRGQDLLTLRRLPVEGAMDRGKPFEPAEVFAFAAIKTLQLVATAPSGRDDIITQDLELTSPAGQKRRVQLRFEGHAWTLHDPDLGGL